MKRIVIICLSAILVAGYVSIYAKKAGAYIKEVYNYYPNSVKITDSDGKTKTFPTKRKIITNLRIGPENEYRTRVKFLNPQGKIIKEYHLYDKDQEIWDKKGSLIYRKSDEIIPGGMAWGHQKKNNVILYLTPNKTLRFFIVKRSHEG